MSARLIVITVVWGQSRKLSYKWIAESDVDATIDGYLEEIGDLQIDWETYYSSEISKDAKVFMGLCASDETSPAVKKKEFVRD